MNWILYMITIIFVFCFMCLGVKSRIREIKERREELAREGNLAPPKVGLMRTLRITGIMVGSSMGISFIFGYVRNVKFSLSTFLGITFLVFLIECIIGSEWSFIQRVIKSYKEDGLVVTLIALLITALWIVGFIYVKYSR